MDTINPKTKLIISFDYRIISVILLLVITGMLAVWRPWDGAQTGDRTIKVSGQATVTAEPDEYVFYPNYDFRNTDKQAALAQLSAKSDELVAKLKGLGVATKDIKTNSDGYEATTMIAPAPAPDTDTTPVYNLRLTVTVGNKELAQTVQDYLITTSPTGSVSPQASFSDKKQRELERSARDQATKDARAKADQSAQNLGFTVGNVKTVTDGAFDGIAFASERGMAVDAAEPAIQKLDVMPGQNELNYTVSVTYFVK